MDIVSNLVIDYLRTDGTLSQVIADLIEGGHYESSDELDEAIGEAINMWEGDEVDCDVRLEHESLVFSVGALDFCVPVANADAIPHLVRGFAGLREWNIATKAVSRVQASIGERTIEDRQASGALVSFQDDGSTVKFFGMN